MALTGGQEYKPGALERHGAGVKISHWEPDHSSHGWSYSPCRPWALPPGCCHLIPTAALGLCSLGHRPPQVWPPKMGQTHHGFTPRGLAPQSPGPPLLIGPSHTEDTHTASHAQVIDTLGWPGPAYQVSKCHLVSSAHPEPGDSSHTRPAPTYRVPSVSACRSQGTIVARNSWKTERDVTALHPFLLVPLQRAACSQLNTDLGTPARSPTLHLPPQPFSQPVGPTAGCVPGGGGSRRAALGWGGTGSWQLASWGSPSWLSASQGDTLFERSPRDE